jgi:hypothetical protein
MMYAFYDQTDGFAVGFPFTPVITNYYMECSKHLAISSVIRRSTHWYKYVGDTFIVWPRRKEKLRKNY